MPSKYIHILSILTMIFAIPLLIGCGDDGESYQNLSPNKAANPLPPDQAVDQPLNTQLIWRGFDPDGDPLTYDVYFGTAGNPPVVAQNQSDTTYNPGQLQPTTIYYWKIVVKDPRTSRLGDIWRFTTGTE